MSEPVLTHPHLVDHVRLDQWLWAARMFRSRTLAKEAIEGGKVRYQGERPKVSRSVEVGVRVTVRQDGDEAEYRVLALSGTRTGAPLARLLYEETAESRSRREALRFERQAAGPLPNPQRPTKKERRQIHRFKREL